MFGKRATAKLILITGSAMALTSLSRSRSLAEGIVGTVLFLPGMFLTLLASSGMSAFPADYTFGEVVRMHVFHVPWLLLTSATRLVRTRSDLSTSRSARFPDLSA